MPRCRNDPNYKIWSSITFGVNENVSVEIQFDCQSIKPISFREVQKLTSTIHREWIEGNGTIGPIIDYMGGGAGVDHAHGACGSPASTDFRARNFVPWTWIKLSATFERYSNVKRVQFVQVAGMEDGDCYANERWSFVDALVVAVSTATKEGVDDVAVVVVAEGMNWSGSRLSVTRQHCRHLAPDVCRMAWNK